MSGGKIEVYSFFPVDRASCECHLLIHQWKEKLAMLSGGKRREAVSTQGFITCPRSKVGMKRYKITCKNCNEIQGYCWAKDSTLKDWCDFHYINWAGKHKKIKNKKVDYEYLWKGCFTPHISPITEQLCMECSCGQDTRDFRGNMTLAPKRAYDIEEENKIGREFGKSNSKFKVNGVANNVIPFKEEI